MLNNTLNESEKEEFCVINPSTFAKTKNSVRSEEPCSSSRTVPPPPDSIATDAETQKLLPPPPATSGGVDSGLIPQIDKLVEIFNFFKIKNFVFECKALGRLGA